MTDFSCAGFVVLTNFETDSKSQRAYSNKLSSVLTGPFSVVLIENQEQDDGDCLFNGCLQSAGKGIFDKYYEKRAWWPPWRVNQGPSVIRGRGFTGPIPVGR